MVKIRKPGSIENGITEVLKILNDQEIEETIGKGSSYLRKCSDPDLPQQIDHSDSLKLDLACLKKNNARYRIFTYNICYSRLWFILYGI